MNTSSIALIVSFISLCLSLYVMRRDQGISATASVHMDKSELIGYNISVYTVNLGRSPKTLRNMVLEGENGEIFKHKLRNHDGTHIKLSQSEFHEFIFTQRNSELTTWAKSGIKSVKITDSYGYIWDVMDFVDIINNRYNAENHLTHLKRTDFIEAFIRSVKWKIPRKPT